MTTIGCCHGCVPPKRTPYCHSTCETYIAAKAEYEAKRREELKQRDIQARLRSQEMDSMERAYKAQRRKRRW